MNQGFPDGIPLADRKGRGVPVPTKNAPVGRDFDVRAQRDKLRVVEFRTLNLANIATELCGRDGRNAARNVGLRAVQECQVGVEEVVSLRHGSDLVQRRVPRTDDGHGPRRDG